MNMNVLSSVNILGTEYTIKRKSYGDEPNFKNKGIDGWCNFYSKEIVYCDLYTHPNHTNESSTDIENAIKLTIRHEILHAFFNESGLSWSSQEISGPWSANEEMIDWFAIQSPKIFKTYKELEIFPDIKGGNVE